MQPSFFESIWLNGGWAMCLVLASGCSDRAVDNAAAAGEEPFEVELDPDSVSVHDPMIIRADGRYYVFGSHLAAAKSDDLIRWESVAGDWDADNPIIPHPDEELREAMEWPEPDAESTWAKSPIELNGRYYLYFSAAHWDSPRSNISLAISDDIEGPYAFDRILIKKYFNGEYSEEVDAEFDDSIHPGVIDPHVFFAADGLLWMVYGSYSGGIHILELDPETGYPRAGQGYGKRIAGGNHAPMEGPYILYHEATGYYYLMVSFGTLGADGGYNIRVARSENPDGPYRDPMGQVMTAFIDEDIDGRDWSNAEPYGAKLVGNFVFADSGIGYLSPGHNSAYADPDSDKLYAVFHARYPGQGNWHQVRVHPLFVNAEGWLVMAPHAYRGERIRRYSEEEVVGTYQFIHHGRSIQASFGIFGGDVNYSETIELRADGTVRGSVEGSWQLVDGNRAAISIDGQDYAGVFLEQWDRGLEADVMTFSALSAEGIAVWGSQLPGSQ